VNSRALAFGLLALLVLFGIARMLSPGEAAPRERGVDSAGDQGRLALLRLLQAADFSVERWSGRPGALPPFPGTLWLAQLPPPFAGAEQDEAAQDEPLRDALARGWSNPQHYRRFAAQGGNVIVELHEDAELRRLAQEFGFIELEHLRLEAPGEERTEAAQGASWVDGEQLSLAVDASTQLLGLESVPDGVRLLDTDQDRALGFEVPIGRGALLLVLGGSMFDNQRLARHDHAVLAVRLAERGPRAGTIHLDEFTGLGGGAPTLLELALAPRALPFTLAFAALALLALWRSFGAREIPLEAPPPAGMSPLTRTLARGRLLQRAKRYDMIAGQLRRGTLRRVGARAGIPAAQSLAAASGPQAAAAWAQRAAPGSDPQRWVELLCARDPQRAAELERFDLELRELELQVMGAQPSGAARTRARAGAHPSYPSAGAEHR